MPRIPGGLHVAMVRRPDKTLSLFFAALFVIPFLLFYLLLGTLTGEFDITFLVSALKRHGGMLYLRAWLTGYVLLSLVTALCTGGIVIYRFIRQTYRAGKSVPANTNMALKYAIIETEEKIVTEEEKAQNDRYALLLHTLNDQRH